MHVIRLLLRAAVVSVLIVATAAPSPAGAAGTDFSTSTSWVWVQRPLAAAAGADHFVTATLSGATTPGRNAGLVVRQSAPDRYVLVSFSATRYQVRLVAGTKLTLVVDKPYTAAASSSGPARTEVRGTTISTAWGAAQVSRDTVAGLTAYTGTGTGLAIWQDAPGTVRITAAVSGTLAPVTATPAPPVTAVPPPGTGPRTWRSGASGDGVANGRFAAWRGTPVDIAGTWNDDAAAQANLWSIAPGAEYGSWQGDLDISIGGIYKDRGDTWQAAAAGAYDARWRASLTKLNRLWGSRPGTMYIRFAHEFNGDWYPWSVQASEVPSFVASWKRFHAIQQEVAQRHKLVFCPNVATSGITGLDWRKAFPGTAYVDVMAVDAYNQYPFVTTSADFAATARRVDELGAPSGLDSHRRFAESVGLPFAVSEWSSNAALGDSPVFVTEMRRWLIANAGTGAGRVVYEVQFNVFHGDGRFQFFPGSRQPGASSTYAQLF